MDEKESNKRENSMLGPQGTGHAQNFAKGDSPLAVSGAEISRFQPEGHENISRTQADHEIRVSDFARCTFSHVGRARIALGRGVAKTLANCSNMYFRG